MRSAELGRGGHHLFDVVEQQQHGAVPEEGLEEIDGGVVAHFQEAKSLRDGRDHQERITDRGEGDEESRTAVRIRVTKIKQGDLKWSSGVLDTAGPR